MIPVIILLSVIPSLHLAHHTLGIRGKKDSRSRKPFLRFGNFLKGLEQLFLLIASGYSNSRYINIILLHLKSVEMCVSHYLYKL